MAYGEFAFCFTNHAGELVCDSVLQLKEKKVVEFTISGIEK